MKVTLVHIEVKAEHVADFIQACRLNHLASIQEPGNRRFDVLQSPDDPAKFILYEAFNSDQAAAAHKQAEHYLHWRETVADWMASPRQGITYDGLFPDQ
ncbi:MAG: antibiotic biosynthesis monooxygenase [Gammaproteobacteria bacterium]